MSIKDLIKAELDHLSEADLVEVYKLLKRRHERDAVPHDDLGKLLELCQMSTGIPDLAEQYSH